jgi:hypothetical protein
MAATTATAAQPEGFAPLPPDPTGPLVVPVLDPTLDPLGVVDLPEGTDPRILRAFLVGTAVGVADGRQIAVLAEPGVPAIKIRHVARTIEELITPIPLPENAAETSVPFRWPRDGWGERLCDVGAVVVVVRSARFVPQAALDALSAGGLAVTLIGADEVALPGGPEEARGVVDAAFKDVLRMGLTHGAGMDLRSAVVNAGGVDAVIRACVWHAGQAPDEEGAAAEDRSAARALARQLLPDRRGVLMQVWPGFSGEFSLEPGDARPESWSRLARVELLGQIPAGLRGGAFDDELFGNDAGNVLTGGGGDDRIDGRGGVDAAVFTGPAREYHIELDAGVARVADLTPDRDGTDVLVGVEVLRFADGDVPTGGPGFEARAQDDARAAD